ncbi:MAG: lysozyme [Robiginitomaculum sp.]|nr:MAG: lysozyme [Robiginitomaculum sp.]
MRATSYSKACVALIKKSEGLVLLAYLDSAGIPTIGWGHTHGVSKEDVYSNRKITRAQAISYLNADIQDAATVVLNAVKVDLNQGQLDALTSFVFNLGASAFLSSTMLRNINRGQFDTVPFELSRWVYATNAHTGKKERLNGLVARRAAEAELFAKHEKPSTKLAHFDISPSPVREERSTLDGSRTMLGGGLSLAGTATTAVGAATSSMEPLTEKVSWLPDALAALVIVGVIAALIGVGVVMYARRDDFLRAKR